MFYLYRLQHRVTGEKTVSVGKTKEEAVRFAFRIDDRCNHMDVWDEIPLNDCYRGTGPVSIDRFFSTLDQFVKTMNNHDVLAPILSALVQEAYEL